MIKFSEFLLTEAAAAPSDAHKATVAHYDVARGLHKHVGGNVSDLHAHLKKIAKKNKVAEPVSVDHHESDKYRERHHTELMPASKHTNFKVKTHGGHHEQLFVDHNSEGKIHRIGHHSSTDKTYHDIHLTDRSLTYVNGKKTKTGRHGDGYTAYEHHT